MWINVALGLFVAGLGLNLMRQGRKPEEGSRRRPKPGSARYEASFKGGRDLLLAGLFVAIASVLLSLMDLPDDTYTIANIAVIGAALFIAIGFTFLRMWKFVKKERGR